MSTIKQKIEQFQIQQQIGEIAVAIINEAEAQTKEVSEKGKTKAASLQQLSEMFVGTLSAIAQAIAEQQNVQNVLLEAAANAGLELPGLQNYDILKPKATLNDVLGPTVSPLLRAFVGLGLPVNDQMIAEHGGLGVPENFDDLEDDFDDLEDDFDGEEDDYYSDDEEDEDF